MYANRRAFLKAGVALAAGSAFWPNAITANVAFAAGALKDTLDDVLRSAVERGDIPGVVAAVTDRDATTYEAAFGERALGQGSAMTLDTVFNIASMTKAIAATAAMQQVEQGKLDLESPISKWVPGAAKLQVVDGWDGDTPRLRAPKREVTLRDLLTHSSGFVYNLWDADFDRFMTAKEFPALNSGKEEAFYPPLMFDPGERWEYGISIDWAGKLVETVSGKTLGTYMQENILVPLGMSDTGYKLRPETEARLVTIHQRGEDGKFSLVEWKGQPEKVLEFGGGGLYSTAGDYLKFVRMILNKGTGNGNQILKPETVELMSKNAMGDLRVTMLKTTNPARSVDAEFFPGLPKSWGLSFMINEETAPTGRPAGSLAWAGLYNTFFWIDPRNGIGGVYMAQVLPFVDEKTLAPFYAFEKAVYDSMA